MRRIVILAIAALMVTAGNAMADSIAGRLGVSGKLGATAPLKDDLIAGTSDIKAGFSGGGGLIYGFGENGAVDLEVFHMPQLDVETGGVKTYEASITDIALGLQFRFSSASRMVPYIGLGPDFIRGNLRHVNGAGYKLDWTYGGHINVGFDWFVTRGVAMTADVRGVCAADGDVKSGSTNVSEYSPRWFQGTVGVRLMLPEKFWSR